MRLRFLRASLICTSVTTPSISSTKNESCLRWGDIMEFLSSRSQIAFLLFQTQASSHCLLRVRIKKVLIYTICITHYYIRSHLERLQKVNARRSVIAPKKWIPVQSLLIGSPEYVGLVYFQEQIPDHTPS